MGRNTKQLYSGMKLDVGNEGPKALGALDRTEVLGPDQVDAVDATAVLDPAAVLDSTALLDDADGSQLGRLARRCPKCGSHYSGDATFCPFDGEPLEDAPEWDPGADPLIGRTVRGRFEVENVIAEGGMGTVYRVRHATLDNVFAMKVLRRDLARDDVVTARLVDEARATAAIGHPNIVAVTDFGEIDSAILPDLGPLKLPYFVMELIGGHSLLALIRNQGPLSPERTATLMLEVAAALEAAHNAGIIHRDLKPENIRVVEDGSKEIAKVLDFGVAKVIGSSRKTQKGMVFGTPHYMSPEQGQGHAVDQRTDIYAMGVIIYECLTGKVPFAADTFMGVVTKHMFARPEPLAVARPEAGDSPLEPVMMRCLEKEPRARYQSMAELAVDLELSIQGSPAARLDARRPAMKLRADEPESLGPADRLTLPATGVDARIWFAVGAAGLVFAGGLVAWMYRPAFTPPSATTAATVAPTAASLSTSDGQQPGSAAGTVARASSAGPTSSQSSSAAPFASSLPSPQTSGVSPRPKSTRPGPTTKPKATRPKTTKPKATTGGGVIDPWGKKPR